MLKVTQRQSGLTVIEIMIALIIIAVMYAVAAPNFVIFIRNSQIRNAANAVQDGLAVARAEAVHRNTSVQFALNGTSSAWVVGCVAPVGDTDGDGVDDCPASIQSRDASEGATSVSVTATPAAASTINFNGLGQATSLALGTTGVFDITHSAGPCVAAGGKLRCLRIIVMPAGQIRMCDPGLTLTNPTNPQAC